MKIIKRYPNRKLYNTNDHHYITVKELRALIQTKEEVVVIDHSTGNNITNRAIVEAYCDYLKENHNNDSLIKVLVEEMQDINS